MRDRAEKILRYAGLTLVALVGLQVFYALFQACQLVGVKVPEVPTLADTNTTVAASSPAGRGPSPSSMVVSNKNSIATNAVVSQNKRSTTTNLAMLDPRNAKTNAVSTNGIVAAGTNVISSGSVTNVAKKHHSHPPGMEMGARPMMPGMMGMPGSAGPPLPPQIQAEVDQIVNSGILGPVMHPPPMGLMGIAGDVAFLRTDSGQSGMVKEGDSLGDLKLLRIGINRVLVEQNGQTKELTIFDGYGGDSLLTNKTETQNENIQNHKQAN